jgi:hypothetical protein
LHLTTSLTAAHLSFPLDASQPSTQHCNVFSPPRFYCFAHKSKCLILIAGAQHKIYTFWNLYETALSTHEKRNLTNCTPTTANTFLSSSRQGSDDDAANEDYYDNNDNGDDDEGEEENIQQHQAPKGKMPPKKSTPKGFTTPPPKKTSSSSSSTKKKKQADDDVDVLASSLDNTTLADRTYTVFSPVVQYAFRCVGTGFIDGSRECIMDFHVHSVHTPGFQVDVSEDGKHLFLRVRLPHGLIYMDRAQKEYRGNPAWKSIQPSMAEASNMIMNKHGRSGVIWSPAQVVTLPFACERTPKHVTVIWSKGDRELHDFFRLNSDIRDNEKHQMCPFLKVVLKSLDKAVNEGPDTDAFVVRSPDDDDDNTGGRGGFGYGGGLAGLAGLGYYGGGGGGGHGGGGHDSSPPKRRRRGGKRRTTNTKCGSDNGYYFLLLLGWLVLY